MTINAKHVLYKGRILKKLTKYLTTTIALATISCGWIDTTEAMRHKDVPDIDECRLVTDEVKDRSVTKDATLKAAFDLIHQKFQEWNKLAQSSAVSVDDIKKKKKSLICEHLAFFKNFCYGTTKDKRIQGDDDKIYTFDEIILNNFDNEDQLKKTLMIFHICYNSNICAGNPVKIIKLFLCSNDVDFDSGQPDLQKVEMARKKLSAEEKAYVDALQSSFFSHISKHWYHCESKKETVADLASKHNAVSGLAVYSTLSPNISAMMQAVNDLVKKADLSKLQIFIKGGHELTISTHDLLTQEHPSMIEMNISNFSDSLFAVFSLKKKDAKDVRGITKNRCSTIDISELVKKPTREYTFIEEGKAIILTKTLTKARPQQVIGFFFQLKFPCFFRVGVGAGSFYIRNIVAE